ncbi:hypothetical protein LCGC14_2882580 [marine sediment metagenome]|uniref:Uncharacterized protein n=1 Tax=marine sediment metagenome TaxID=412755 RepID=A0A0F9A7M8_9ZZZZ
MKAFDTFTELVNDQFSYGGKKYGLSTNRESTDELFDAHGKNWLIGTIDKYTYRFKNLQRERDLLKIGTYQYILWLKRGFFLQDRGVNDAIDTNIKVKTEQFDKFIKVIWDYFEQYKSELVAVENKMGLISTILQKWSLSKWSDVLQTHLSQVYCLVFLEWHSHYSKVVEHDKDTYNEEKHESNKT